MRVVAVAVFLAATLAAASVAIPAAGFAPGDRPMLDVAFKRLEPSRAGKPGAVEVQIVNRGRERLVELTLRVTAPTWVRLVGRGCRPLKGGVSCRLGDLSVRGRVTVHLTATPSRDLSFGISAQVAAQTANTAARVVAVSLDGFRATIEPVAAGLARCMTGVSWKRAVLSR